MIRVTLALAMAADGIITWQVLQRDGLDREGNPALRWVVARWHSKGMVALKLISFAALLLVYSRYHSTPLLGAFTGADVLVAACILYLSAALLGYARLLRW